MTDNEIIKAMQCVIGNEALCSECTYQKVLPFPSCRRKCAKNALDLINRQKAEIERLEEMLDSSVSSERNAVDNIDYEKTEAIKEFAERLKNCFAISGDYLDIINIIDNLVKEMTEIETNQRKEDEKR